MQFSEVSELEQFNRLQNTPQVSFLYRYPNSYVPIHTLQDLNLFPLHDILNNSLNPDPRFQTDRPIKLGSSNEKTDDILNEIKSFVSKSELKPLEQIKKSKRKSGDIKNEKELVIEETDETPPKNHDLRIKPKRTVSEDFVLIMGHNKDKKEEVDEIKSDQSSENNENNEAESSPRRTRSSKKVNKRYSFNWIEDGSKKKFKKVNIEFEQSKSKSLLSEQIHNIPAKRNGKLVNSFFAMKTAANSKIITVFFFSTPLSIKVPINVNNSVQEVIIAIICYYMNAAKADLSLMKYPYMPEAYELRILEDDDDYRPEMSFDPLEKQKRFGEYGIEQVAFCEIEGFRPSNAQEEEESKVQKNKENQDEFMKVLGDQKLLIQIYIPHQNYSSLMQMEPNKHVRDIFPQLQKKVKLDEKKLKVFTEVGPMEEEGLYVMEDQEVDINMPLANLKKKLLKIMKKTFADDGDVSLNTNTVRSSRNGEDVEEKDNKNSSNAPETLVLSEIQAAKYEEFELVKLDSSKNKKGPRILAIGQFKIYQKYKEKAQSKLFSP